MRYPVLLFAALLALFSAPARAQVSMSDMMAPNKEHGCASTVVVKNIFENADLAFTGRVIKRTDNFTWFRVFVVHHGKPRHHIIKTAGFFSREGYGNAQSYETGDIYTAVVHRPANRDEKALGVYYVNSLDNCEQAVISKIHDRYGNYRVEPDQLKPGFWQKLGNHWFYYKPVYLSLLLLIVLAAAGWRFRTKIRSFAGRLGKPA